MIVGNTYYPIQRFAFVVSWGHSMPPFYKNLISLDSSLQALAAATAGWRQVTARLSNTHFFPVFPTRARTSNKGTGGTIGFDIDRLHDRSVRLM